MQFTSDAYTVFEAFFSPFILQLFCLLWLELDLEKDSEKRKVSVQTVVKLSHTLQ